MAVEGTMTEEKTDEAPKKAPRKRTPKPDAIVGAAQELARAVLAEEFPGEEIGEHLGASAEDDRVMTHAFAASKKGYRGWEWFVTLSRAPRAKEATVCEWGLRPGGDALLAPPWIPWADRVRPEDTQVEEPESGDAPAAESAPEAVAAEKSAEEPETEHDADAAEASGSHAVENPADAADGELEIEDDLTAEEIEASVAVKRRGRRRRRYSTRAKKQ